MPPSQQGQRHVARAGKPPHLFSTVQEVFFVTGQSSASDVNYRRTNKNNHDIVSQTANRNNQVHINSLSLHFLIKPFLPDNVL
jgi:hypothetical protein